MAVAPGDNLLMDEMESAMNEVLRMSTADVMNRTRLIESEIRIMSQDLNALIRESLVQKQIIKDNGSKVKLSKKLPYLVSNVVELLEIDLTEENDDGAVNLIDTEKNGTSIVIKTSTGQTIFLPIIGLVESSKLSPGDLVGVNKESFLIMEIIAPDYDPRVQAMEVVERPTEQYTDIGGLDKQIRELIEAIVLPLTHKEKFQKLGIRPPKGVLMFGPPGTGEDSLVDFRINLTLYLIRQNIACSSLCRSNKVNVFETRWIATRSDENR